MKKCEELKECQARKTCGYWKGSPCGNKANYKASDGRVYCYAHIAKALENPDIDWGQYFKKRKKNV